MPIRAVRVVGRLVAGEARLRRLATTALRFLRRSGVETPPPSAAHALLEMDHNQLGEGYGHSTPSAEEAMERFFRAGIVLEPTYTGKAAAALLSSIKRAPDGIHLFWHTLSAVLPEGGEGGSDPRTLPPRFRSFFEREDG